MAAFSVKTHATVSLEQDSSVTVGYEKAFIVLIHVLCILSHGDRGVRIRVDQTLKLTLTLTPSS